MPNFDGTGPYGGSGPRGGVCIRRSGTGGAVRRPRGGGGFGRGFGRGLGGGRGRRR